MYRYLKLSCERLKRRNARLRYLFANLFQNISNGLATPATSKKTRPKSVSARVSASHHYKPTTIAEGSVNDDTRKHAKEPAQMPCSELKFTAKRERVRSASYLCDGTCIDAHRLKEIVSSPCFPCSIAAQLRPGRARTVSRAATSRNLVRKTNKNYLEERE
jgi:hypothetical protein